MLATGSTGAALLAFTVGATMVVYALVSGSGPGVTIEAPEVIQAFVVGGAVVMIGALSLPAAYYSLRRLRASEIAAYSPKPLGLWLGLGISAIWISSLLAAQFLAQQQPWKWLAPGYHFLAIAAPVFFLLWLATGGLSGGSRQRLWGLLTTGMLLGTSLAVLVEVGIAALGLMAGGVYLVLHPQDLLTLQQLAAELERISTMQEALEALRPWLDHPQLIILALAFFSGVTPLIEEGAKSLGAWAIFDRLRIPADGFVAGVIGGAGFGLVEGLFASAQPDQNWALTLMIRGGSTMMHITAAGLAGWGIGSYRVSGRFGRMLSGYALAVLIHGLWNAAVVGLVVGGLRVAVNAGQADSLALVLLLASGLALASLCIGMPIALTLINRKLRSDQPSLAVVTPTLEHDVPPGENPAAGGEGR